MSAAAYGGNSEADAYLAANGYHRDDDPNLTDRGFSWKKALTEGVGALWNRPNASIYEKDGKATIAYRGTDLFHANASDLVADLELTLGMNDVAQRFHQAEDIYSKTVAKYGEGNVEVTGHSLGGAEALYVARNHHISGTVFNPGQVPVGDYAAKEFGETLEGTNKSDVTTVLTTDHWLRNFPDRYKFGADAISVSSEAFPEKRVYVERKDYGWKTWGLIGSLNAHGLDNFTHPVKKTLHFDLDKHIQGFYDHAAHELTGYEKDPTEAADADAGNELEESEED